MNPWLVVEGGGKIPNTYIEDMAGMSQITPLLTKNTKVFQVFNVDTLCTCINTLIVQSFVFKLLIHFFIMKIITQSRVNATIHNYLIQHLKSHFSWFENSDLDSVELRGHIQFKIITVNHKLHAN